MADPKTSLVPLAPIDLAEIPDAGNTAMRQNASARTEARKLLKRAGLAGGAALLFGWSFALWGGWPMSLAMIFFTTLVAMAAMAGGAYALYGLPSAILRLAMTSRFNGLPDWSSVPLALEEGDLRHAAKTWNEAYAECRLALVDIGEGAPVAPKEMARIAKTVRELGETRARIVGRIDGLKAMVPPPADGKPIDLAMWEGWPLLGDGSDPTGPK